MDLGRTHLPEMSTMKRPYRSSKIHRRGSSISISISPDDVAHPSMPDRTLDPPRMEVADNLHLRCLKGRQGKKRKNSVQFSSPPRSRASAENAPNSSSSSGVGRRASSVNPNHHQHMYPISHEAHDDFKLYDARRRDPKVNGSGEPFCVCLLLFHMLIILL